VAALLDEVALFETTGTTAKQLCEAEEVMKRLSVARLTRRLAGFLSGWEQRLSKGRAVVQLTPDGLQHDLPVLIDQIIVKVQEGVAARYAIFRVRVLFEHFLRRRVREEIKAAEGASRRTQREAILQGHMDEFLFREGYFPLTHSAASGGYTDTVILERARASGLPPLIVELKQAVNIRRPAKVTRAQVAAAIAGAQGEVARYRGHLATYPEWRDLVPVIVVIHSCREDLSDLNGDGVVVIDLSDRVPSGKTPRKVKP
jgi:hypothetical protein